MQRESLAEAIHLTFTSDPTDIANCNAYIITVPAPIDRDRRPAVLHDVKYVLPREAVDERL